VLSAILTAGVFTNACVYDKIEMLRMRMLVNTLFADSFLKERERNDMSAWDSIQNQIKNRQTMGNHVQHPSTKKCCLIKCGNMNATTVWLYTASNDKSSSCCGKSNGDTIWQATTGEKAKGSI